MNTFPAAPASTLMLPAPPAGAALGAAAGAAFGATGAETTGAPAVVPSSTTTLYTLPFTVIV